MGTFCLFWINLARHCWMYYCELTCLGYRSIIPTIYFRLLWGLPKATPTGCGSCLAPLCRGQMTKATASPSQMISLICQPNQTPVCTPCWFDHNPAGWLKSYESFRDWQMVRIFLGTFADVYGNIRQVENCLWHQDVHESKGPPFLKCNQLRLPLLSHPTSQYSQSI